MLLRLVIPFLLLLSSCGANEDFSVGLLLPDQKMIEKIELLEPTYQLISRDSFDFNSVCLKNVFELKNLGEGDVVTLRYTGINFSIDTTLSVFDNQFIPAPHSFEHYYDTLFYFTEWRNEDLEKAEADTSRSPGPLFNNLSEFVEEEKFSRFLFEDTTYLFIARKGCFHNFTEKYAFYLQGDSINLTLQSPLFKQRDSSQVVFHFSYGKEEFYKAFLTLENESGNKEKYTGTGNTYFSFVKGKKLIVFPNMGPVYDPLWAFTHFLFPSTIGPINLEEKNLLTPNKKTEQLYELFRF